MDIRIYLMHTKNTFLQLNYYNGRLSSIIVAVDKGPSIDVQITLKDPQKDSYQVLRYRDQHK